LTFQIHSKDKSAHAEHLDAVEEDLAEVEEEALVEVDLDGVEDLAEVEEDETMIDVILVEKREEIRDLGADLDEMEDLDATTTDVILVEKREEILDTEEKSDASPESRVDLEEDSTPQKDLPREDAGNLF
jgi:hypothetical protein